MLTGLDDLVSYILSQKHVSKWYLKGFQRLSPKGRQFVAMAAMCSFPSDCLLAELLEDDRVAKRLFHLQTVLQDEMAWVAHLPMTVWDQLARVVSPDTCARVLRSDTGSSPHLSGLHP